MPEAVAARTGLSDRSAPLWQHIASRLVPESAGDFETDASLLLLAYADTSTDARITTDQVAAALSKLDRQRSDGRPL
jgi:hypothetical protein